MHYTITVIQSISRQASKNPYQILALGIAILSMIVVVGSASHLSIDSMALALILSGIAAIVKLTDFRKKK